MLRPNFFVEAQYSARHLTFTDVGADTRDLIHGTMILDVSKNARFWSPTFCSGATCDGDEQRNNSNFIVKASSFLSDAIVRHASRGVRLRLLQRQHLGEHAPDRQRLPHSRDQLDFHGRDDLSPVHPGSAATSTIIECTPIHQLSEGSNLRTHSLFVNDTWRLSNQFTFGLGLRFDRNQATDGSGKNVGDDMNFSPRLSAVWDPGGRRAMVGIGQLSRAT